MLFCRFRRSWKVCPVTEARRLSATPGEGRGGEFLSEDMGDCGSERLSVCSPGLSWCVGTGVCAVLDGAKLAWSRLAKTGTQERRGAIGVKYVVVRAHGPGVRVGRNLSQKVVRQRMGEEGRGWAGNGVIGARRRGHKMGNCGSVGHGTISNDSGSGGS
jgi:hypothetical protein